MGSYPYPDDEFSSATFHSTQLIVRTDLAMIFAPKRAYVFGYVMIAPVRQVTHFENISPEELVAIAQLISRIDTTYRASLAGYTGYTLTLNRGSIAGQKVPHAHFHFFPHAAGEDTHPLYQQLKPDAFGLHDPGLAHRVNEIRERIPPNEDVPQTPQAEASQHFSIETGSMPTHTTLFAPGISDITHIDNRSAQNLLSALRSLIETKETEDHAFNGYTLIVPHKDYAFTRNRGLHIHIFWRSTDETQNPLKAMPLQKHTFN